MTVQELIDELQKLDPDADVAVGCYWDDVHEADSIGYNATGTAVVMGIR